MSGHDSDLHGSLGVSGGRCPLRPSPQARTAGRASGGDFHATGAAQREGRLDVEQAQVIVASVDKLPASVGPELRRSAEKHFLGLADGHDARELRLLGRHLHEVVDPEGADAENGSMLAAALNAIASPKRPDPIARHRAGLAATEQPAVDPADESDGASGDLALTAPEVLGQAFCEYVERFPAAGYRALDLRGPGASSRLRGRPHPHGSREWLGRPRRRPQGPAAHHRHAPCAAHSGSSSVEPRRGVNRAARTADTRRDAALDRARRQSDGRGTALPAMEGREHHEHCEPGARGVRPLRLG